MAKPLDFLHKNNNENEWAKRYVANKMGMQTGGSVMPWKQKAQNAIRDMRMGWLAKKDPQLRAYLDDTGIENWQEAIARGQSTSKFTEDNEGSLSDFISDQSTEFTKGGMKGAILRNIMKEQIKDGNISDNFSEEFSLETDKGKYNLEQFNPFGKIRMDKEGYQDGGVVFDPESSGYDMQTALAAGLERDAETGHMGSLDPRTGMVLKGRQHESWNPMAQTEMSLGNTVEYDPDKGRYFSVQGGMYESAPADETAHDQMNNLIFENEMKQSQGASPLSFLNQDRIDSQNQELMDAVMSMSVPAAGAISLSKSAFGKLANLSKSKVLNQIPEMLETGKVNWNQFARKGLPKSAQKSFDNIKDLKWLEDLIRRNQ